MTSAIADYPRYARHLASALARHPQAILTIADAIRPDPEFGTGAPWWNRRAVAYLGRWLRPGMRVLEFGSGGSTAWLISHGAVVTSVEHDPAWAARVRARCPGADVRAIPPAASGEFPEPVHTRKVSGRNRFMDAYLNVAGEFPDRSLDLAIVDGMCRAECLRRCAPKIRPGGLLVLDDSETPAYRRLGDHLPGWERVAFAGFKSSKGVAETSFYRRPR